METTEKVYQFIKNYIEENGFSPSVRELCQGVGFSSTATAQYHIKKLISEGKITLSGAKNRTITLTNRSEKRAKFIPIVGTVTAGLPILAVENLQGYCPIPDEFKDEEDMFALQIKGDSMIGAGIFNGDKIIVKKTPVCEDGDIIVALIDDEATCKRFYRRGNKIVLHPENSAYSNMIFDDVIILGQVKGLIRKY